MRKNYHVTKTDRGWVGRQEDTNQAVAKGATKKEVVGQMIRFAKNHQPSSLKIHKVDGRIQEERTYPRSSDPRRTKG